MNMHLAPSILAADFSGLGDEITLCEKAGASYIHLDVMDGNFVPNITFGPLLIKSIRPLTALSFDTHLMIADPNRYVTAFREAGADIITIHAEATKHIDRSINLIKETGAKAGLALNPATPLELLRDILPSLDMVLLMSVNPGFGGQKFIPYVYDKLRRLSAMIKSTGKDIDIEVDGGVDSTNIKRLKDAGANVFVAGSAVFNGNISDNIKMLKGLIK